MPEQQPLSSIVVGGGCFWCLEAVYQRTPGVSKVVSGYAGGALANPTYEQVCSGTTEHAEVIQIDFDPATASFEKILEVFWAAHDPTTRNRQGHDVGSQYRSIILAADEQQLEQAHASMAQAQPAFNAPIVTEIKLLEKFWPAENIHQNYYNDNKTQPYCMFNIVPKLKKLGL